MRQRFEQQMNLRTVAIADVKFPLKSRDELPPVLMALQYIFITPELNEKVLGLLENKICLSKNRKKRHGSMAYTCAGCGEVCLRYKLGYPLIVG